jgi:hypothetical protein
MDPLRSAVQTLEVSLSACLGLASPCPQGLDCSPSCRIPGRLVLQHFAADRYSRGQALALLAAFVAGHRLLLVAALLVRDSTQCCQSGSRRRA